MAVWTPDGGITVVNSQLTSDTFNIVHIQNTSLPGFTELKTVVDYTIYSQLPFCFWLSETAANASTLDGLQQLGEVLMRHALNYAKLAGFKTALLQSFDDGFRIYQKFGFQKVTTYYDYQVAQ